MLILKKYLPLSITLSDLQVKLRSLMVDAVNLRHPYVKADLRCGNSDKNLSKFFLIRWNRYLHSTIRLLSTYNVDVTIRLLVRRRLYWI